MNSVLITTMKLLQAAKNGCIVACRRLSGVQVFSQEGHSTSHKHESNVGNELGQRILYHPVHLLARMPAFHSAVVGKGIDSASDCSEQKAVTETLFAQNSNVPCDISKADSGMIETCTVVVNSAAFMKKGALRHSDDKDTVGQSYIQLYTV